MAESPLIYKWRVFPSSVVRDCCARIYGKKISSHAWRNWRSWAGISKNQRLIELDRFIDLAAIAEIRRGSQFVELRSSQVSAIAEQPQFRSRVLAAAAYLDRRNYIQGREVRDALAARGCQIGRTSLYKRLPGFSVDTIYPLDYVLEVFA